MFLQGIICYSIDELDLVAKMCTQTGHIIILNPSLSHLHATYHLQVVWSRLYKCTSSQDPGTLFQLRNLINRRNVIKDVRNDMNATEDFFKTVLVGHILTAAMQFFGMEDESSTPQHPYFTEDLASQPDSRKWEVLSSCVKQLLDKYVSASLHCHHHPGSIPETNDAIYKYACTILSLGLFVSELDDAIREGDGERLCRVWKYLTLLFHSNGRTKYALEALTLQLQLHGLPPRQAFEVKWSRFINTKGGMGNNVSCDLHMEHLNRACKTAISGVGANVSEKSIDRAAKCLCTTQDVCKNFDLTNDIHPTSSSHTAASVKQDVGLIVKQLQKSQVFMEKADRAHHVFRNVKSCFSIDDPHKLRLWFDKHKKKFLHHHIPESDSDAIYYV